MIKFEDFVKVMSFNLDNKYCIEIEFCIKGSSKFEDCCMGKLHDKSTRRDTFWFGLASDGENGYDYATLDEMIFAKVFDGKSLSEIWESVEISAIDGCDPTERIKHYNAM